jgi:L-malate glycosyltransferase
MKIALCGPTQLHGLAKLRGVDAAGVPEGIGPTPLAPLIGQLLARGHQITLYTLSHDIESECFFDWGSLRVFVGPSRTFGAVRKLYRPEISYLTRVIKADAPPFIHTHWTYEFTLGALGAGIPSIVTIHDLPWNVLRYFRDRCRAVRLVLAYVVATKGSRFTAVSQDAAKHFNRYLRPGTPVQVIPNFLSDRFLELSHGSKPHPNRPLTFATVLQGWSRRKNGTAALQAFARFRRSVPDAHLLMIGTDYHPDGTAAQWAIERDCYTNVEFLGRLPHEQMFTTLRDHADAVLLPSLDEAFSMTGLEAMALGKPIVAGLGTPGFSEMLDAGKAGLLVDVRSPRAIANAMLRLQTDPHLFENLGHAAHRRAVSVYSSANVVAQYEACYAALEATMHPHPAQPVHEEVAI